MEAHMPLLNGLERLWRGYASFRKKIGISPYFRSPTNARLGRLLAGVDSVVIKADGVHNGKAMGDEVVLTLLEPENVGRFGQLLEIVEPELELYCMCLGSYAIELHSEGRLKATIGFHHGTSIRYDAWRGDAELRNPEALVEFLADQGFAVPLEERIEDRRREAEADKEWQNWLAVAPKCFGKYRIQMNTIPAAYWPSLMKDFQKEYPDRQPQIIVLLRTFGATDNLWTNYASYEEVPKEILGKFEVQEIIGAYLASARAMDICKGLGRYLCSFDFKRVRKNYLQFIPQEVINDLESCFEALGEKRGIHEILSLRSEKNSSV